jgi:NADPH:quinone reductase-like Zn-dependent oxidoreductase
MARRITGRRIFRWIGLSIAAIVLALVLAIGLLLLLSPSIRHPAPVPADPAQRMRAVTHYQYGSPAMLKYGEVAKPLPADDDVIVRVHAASVNPYDWHFMRGTPYFVRLLIGARSPADPRTGVDFAGTVEAVGKDVKRFKPGDEVFGGVDGAFAEYVHVKRSIALKPTNVTFEQAAAVGIAGITALQALRDKGHVRPGQHVLINGASGGVGTFAVQIAKALGAEVTGVCSTRNLQLVRSLGADRVIDYTQQDFTRSNEHYDVILDTVGTHSLLEYRRVLTPKGVLVMVGDASLGNWVQPLIDPVKALLLSPFVSQTFTGMLADLTPQDLDVMRELMQSGKVTPVIDRRYPLREVPAAIAYLEQGHARGKVVIDID